MSGRNLVAVAATALASTACIDFASLTAEVEDPSRVVVRVGGADGPELRGGPGPDQVIDLGHGRTVSKRDGAIRVAHEPMLQGSTMGPFERRLGQLWSPGKRVFGVSGAVQLDFEARIRADPVTSTQVYEWSGSTLPYEVLTDIDNVAYFAEPDLPARTIGALLVGVGVLSALGGWWMVEHDGYVKYPGYMFIAGGALQLSIGAVNLLRPKRETLYTQVNPDGTVTERRGEAPR